MAQRCGWVGDNPLYVAYHDVEWGLPVHDDRKLFELLCLEGAQAGLSWITILKKREAYREAFDRFDPHIVARYDRPKVNALLRNAGIVRNRLKVEAFIKNARAYVTIEKFFGSLDAYVWQFVDGKPRRNSWVSFKQIPPYSAEASKLSRDLRARGFTFVGPTICYAFMQSAGLVNDHEVGCFRYWEIGGPK